MILPTIGNVSEAAEAVEQEKEDNNRVVVSHRLNVHTFKVSCHFTNFSLLHEQLLNLLHHNDDANVAAVLLLLQTLRWQQNKNEDHLAANLPNSATQSKRHPLRNPSDPPSELPSDPPSELPLEPPPLGNPPRNPPRNPSELPSELPPEPPLRNLLGNPFELPLRNPFELLLLQLKLSR